MVFIDGGYVEEELVKKKVVKVSLPRSERERKEDLSVESRYDNNSTSNS